MKNAIREFIEYNEIEKKELWNTAVFVFDTNVFLNLYRYSNKTRNQLLESFEWLKARIWMPYQVAFELCKDRCKTINDANNRFEGMRNEADNLIRKWTEKLHLDKNDNELLDLNNYLNNWISQKKDNSFTIFDLSKDVILEKILTIFEGKTGESFSAEEKKDIEQEGAERFKSCIPPGYKDDKKTDNKFGDLLVWKEIISYASNNSVDIIFVTSDQKEDWWNISEGKTIGPRVELRKEFYGHTKRKFHMYSMSEYLKYYMDNQGVTIDGTTLKEVETVSFVDAKESIQGENEDYNNFLKTENEKMIVMLRNRINELERKNTKRRNSLKVLNNKVNHHYHLSEQEKIALIRNSQNLNEDEKLIAQYEERINKLLFNGIE